MCIWSWNPSLDLNPNLTQVSKNMIFGNTRAYSFHVTTTALSVAFQSSNNLSLWLAWALHWHSSEHNYQATFHSTSLKLFNSIRSYWTGELYKEEFSGSVKIDDHFPLNTYISCFDKTLCFPLLLRKCNTFTSHIY